MKEKDIEKELKREAESFAPDPIEKIKFAARAENLLPCSEQNSESYAQGNTAVLAKNDKKKIWLISACALLLAGLILILSFLLPFGRKEPFRPARRSLSTEEVYGMGAVSSVRLLGSNLSVNAVASFSAVGAAVQTRSGEAENLFFAAVSAEEEVKAQAEKFNEYFTALDSFLGEEILSTTTENNPDNRYPYETQMIVNGKDFNGETVTYTMYYTETLVKADESEGESEAEYRLTGVMVIDGVDHYLEGERTEESEEDETETELKIRAYANLSDKTSYVQMEQEYSAEEGETETEYVYSIYSKGELLEQTAVEFETENKNNKVETEYELEFRSGSAKGKYVVEREKKGSKDEIKVKYKIDGESGEFRIREITDENGGKHYEYTFGDREKIVF